MVDIWKYNAGDIVKLTTKKGKTFVGQVAVIWDCEEFEDEDSDRIDLYIENYVTGFKPEEIQSIEKIK